MHSPLPAADRLNLTAQIAYGAAVLDLVAQGRTLSEAGAELGPQPEILALTRDLWAELLTALPYGSDAYVRLRAAAPAAWDRDLRETTAPAG